MTIDQSMPASASSRPLRLWPGVAAAVLLVLLRVVLPVVVPGTQIVGVLGAVACGLVIVVWWLFFSRAPWIERAGAIVLMAAALVVTWRLVDESIRGGMMGMMLGIHGAPVLALALVAGAALGGGFARRRRVAIRVRPSLPD